MWCVVKMERKTKSSIYGSGIFEEVIRRPTKTTSSNTVPKSLPFLVTVQSLNPSETSQQSRAKCIVINGQKNFTRDCSLVGISLRLWQKTQVTFEPHSISRLFQDKNLSKLLKTLAFCGLLKRAAQKTLPSLDPPSPDAHRQWQITPSILSRRDLCRQSSESFFQLKHFYLRPVRLF